MTEWPVNGYVRERNRPGRSLRHYRTRALCAEIKDERVIKCLTLVASESGKIERRANRPCGSSWKACRTCDGDRRKAHLRGSKKNLTFRSTTLTHYWWWSMPRGPWRTLLRFARTSGRGRLCNFNCVLTTVQLDDGEQPNLHFRVYPIKMLPRLTRRPSDFCERESSLFPRRAIYDPDNRKRPIHGDPAATVKFETAWKQAWHYRVTFFIFYNFFKIVTAVALR